MTDESASGGSRGPGRGRELIRLATAAAAVPLIGWAYWALVDS